MTHPKPEEVKVIIQNRGVSASHPIILHLTENEVIVCSIASRECDSLFDYSIVLLRKDFPWNGSDEEIIDAVCYTRKHKESEWGWDLAINRGISSESISAVFNKIQLKHPKIMTRLARSAKPRKRKEANSDS